MDANATSARYQGSIGEPSAAAMFRAEAAAARTRDAVSRDSRLVDDQMRKQARLVRAAHDVTMGAFTRFI